MGDLTETKKEEQAPWGVSTSVDLYGCDPALIRSEQAIRDYVVQLCDLIKMKRFGDTTVVHFGEDERVCGYSMTQLIETSLISGHFANLTNTAYLDIFSCAPYCAKEVAQFSKDFFGAESVKTNRVVRS